MATWKIAPALAAGCTCILKPAEETPLTALALAAMFKEAGVPDGVVNVIPTSRPAETVAAMLHDPRVRKLSFTGSTEVGRLLLKEAADQVISSSMELGGTAPFIVFDDADLDAAVDGAMIAKMRNGGEACTAANRFYVQRGIADRFAALFAERMGAVVVGNGVDAGTTCGPLVNAEAVAKVSALVDDAVARGARVVVGGKAPEREASSSRRPCSPMFPPMRRCCARRFSVPWRPSSLSMTRPMRSIAPTIPNTGSWPTSTPATWRAACAFPKRSRAG
jgi:succinate-semialdehyde dehydrogenase/glutarate-semialdehyde dehydrogenase